MIAQKKEFYGGLVLLVAFVIVLVIIFSPVFNGSNGLEYLDALYNSISKGSAYYIPKLQEEAATFNDKRVEVKLSLSNVDEARQTALLFSKSNVEARLAETELQVTGDLGKILDRALKDADLMYHNKGQAVSAQYGYEEKRVLFNWWNAFKKMDIALKGQKRFKEAKVLALIKKKAIETSYNYYKIDPQSISDRYGIIIFSLIFYVVYTLWYGFAILFMFEGWGLKLEH